MSRAYGVVRFQSDDKLLYYLYDGTSDICVPSLCDNIDDIWKDNGWKKCNCNQDEPVEIYSDYGGGFYWQGRACRHCMCITEKINPWEECKLKEITDEQPQWISEIWKEKE